MIERGFGRAEADDQLARAFIADSLCSRNVVDGVAHQRHDVGDFFRRHAHQLFHFGGIHHQVALRGALSGAKHANASADELHHVFIAGDDVNIEIAFCGLARKAPDHVIGLVARAFDHGQAHGVTQAPHQRNLHGKIVGHGRTVGLVFGEKLVAERRTRRIEHHGYVIGLPLLEYFAEHVRKQVWHFRGDAVALQPFHGREKRTEDEAHGIDEEEFFRGFAGHPSNYIKRGD